MRLSYYHYFFKEARKRKAPRVCKSVLPMLQAYLSFKASGKIFQVTTPDEEEVLLMPTFKADVFMLVATRDREIIKAVNTQSASCVEIAARLQPNERAGFAAYLAVSDDVLGLASTLRGPRTTVLNHFLKSILEQLGGSRWILDFESIGSSITMRQAESMAFIARTTLVVKKSNSFYNQIKELLSSEDVDSFEIIARGKRSQNIAEVFTKMAKESDGGGRYRLKIRAKAAMDEALSDYFIEEDGKMSDDLGVARETEIIQKISKLFNGHELLAQKVEAIKKINHYEQKEVPELHRIGDVAFWNNYLLVAQPSAD